jgi:hypothetical protein
MGWLRSGLSRLSGEEESGLERCTFLRSLRGETLAGLAVVLAIFVSACVALYKTVERLIHPQHVSHLSALAAAGVVGFVGNELAAQVRLRAGRRLASPCAGRPTVTTHGSTASSLSAWLRAPGWLRSGRRSGIRSSGW